MAGQQWALRRGLVLLAGLTALVGATGLTQARVFHDASLTRYLATVAAPLFVGVLATSSNPMAVVTGALVIVAPFAGYRITPGGIAVPLLAPLVVLGVIILLFSSPPRLPRSSLCVGAGLVLVAFVLPVAESPTRTDVVAVLLSLFAAAYFASRVATTSGGFLALAWAFVASALIQAGIAIYEDKTGHRLNLYGSAGSQTFGANSGFFFGFNGQTRPPGAFYDPISLANVLAMSVPLSLGLAIHHIRRRQLALAGVALGSLTVITVALEVTLSRMSWLAAAVGLVVAVALFPREQRRALLPLLALAVLIPALLGVFHGQSSALRRLSSITHPLRETGTGNGDVIRVEVWQRALRVAEEHPIAGVGFGRLQSILAGEFVPAGTQSHAHSTYLQIAAEGGAIALIGLIGLLLALAKDLRGVLRGDRVWGPVLAGACVAMLMCWLTDVTVRYSGVAASMGILFGVVAGRARTTASSRSQNARGGAGVDPPSY